MIIIAKTSSTTTITTTTTTTTTTTDQYLFQEKNGENFNEKEQQEQIKPKTYNGDGDFMGIQPSHVHTAVAIYSCLELLHIYWVLMIVDPVMSPFLGEVRVDSRANTRQTNLAICSGS